MSLRRGCRRPALRTRAIKTLYIRPGSPWEDGHIESFDYKLRDECLNRELFETLAEARVILESWRVEYNEQRPHSSLDYQTPWEFSRAQRKFGLQSAFGLVAWHSTVLLILALPGAQTRSVLIRHEAIARSLGIMFDFFWNQAEPIALHLGHNGAAAGATRSNGARLKKTDTRRATNHGRKVAAKRN